MKTQARKNFEDEISFRGEECEARPKQRIQSPKQKKKKKKNRGEELSKGVFFLRSPTPYRRRKQVPSDSI